MLHEVFVTGTVDKTHLLVMSENVIKVLTNVLLWTSTELATHYLILLLETVNFCGKDILTHVEIEIESELKDLGIKGCSVPFSFGRYYQQRKNYQQLY